MQTIRIKTNAGKKILAYMRRWRDKEVLVFLNFSPDVQEVEISDSHVKEAYQDLFTGESVNLGRIRDLKLEAYAYRVFVK